MKLGAAPVLPVLVALAACGGDEEPRNMTADEVAAELADIRIEPGLWELRSAVTDVRAQNLPREVRSRMIGPRSRLRHCITPEQAQSPNANFLAMRADSACVYRDFSYADGRLSGTMTCPGTVARMEGRYRADRYETRMEMQSPMPGGATMILQIRAMGRRIGECEEGKAK
jgi:hypothetical protein